MTDTWRHGVARWAVLLGCAIGLVLGAPRWSQAQEEPPRGVEVEQPAGVRQGTPLIEAGEAPDVILLYSGDVIGYLDPCG